MASDAVEYQYFTYEGRLASFQKSKKRGSTAKGSKALNWPHKRIDPESLARAGFYFQPWPDNPDNVVCFLCHKSMDGWEEGDDPLEEHLKHSSQCGWAITTAIEVGMGQYAQLHPAEHTMMEARKATFAGMWPHDGKRGWKCKTKQLVEAGWKYTPTLEEDDNATCVYCGLGLDGWEPGDKPYDEHHRRSPDCAFFALSSQPKPRKPRGKAARDSKASRLSTQSVATDAPSMADTTAAGDDTVLTTASTATQGAKKGRGRKGTTTKGRKTKAQKEAIVEFEQVQEPAEQVQSSPPPQPGKAARGKKRGSEAVDESTLTATSEAPARKKRTTKNRESVATEDTAVEAREDHEMADANEPKKAGQKKGPASAQTKRKASTARSSASSIRSTTPVQSVPAQFPDDDEIERQLEAELDRFTDDEEIRADSDSERTRAKTKTSRGKKQPEKKTSQDFAMFDPDPIQPDEEDMEDELNALRVEMATEKLPAHDVEPEPEPAPAPKEEPELQVPKKGRKPGVRKASKQTKSKKVEPAEIPLPDEEPEPVKPSSTKQQPEAPPEERDASLGSNGTVVRTSDHGRQATQKKGRGRPPKAPVAPEPQSEADELADDAVELVAPPPRKGMGPPKASSVSQGSVPFEKWAAETAEPANDAGRDRTSKTSQAAPEATEPPAKRGRGRPPKQQSVESLPADPEAQLQEEANNADMRAAAEEDVESAEEADEEDSGLSAVKEASEIASMVDDGAEPPSTPGHGVSPSASARQAVLSPSQSPQSSDAENHPPSAKQAAEVTTKRVALAPVEATPVRGSPSRRNAIAGLQSKTPWEALDIDAILGTPLAGGDDKENGPERLLKKGRELTSPEKRMTVEEWIYHNAGQAENLLKQECEAMVSRFESEGTKAMRVLEGLVVE